MTGEDKGNLLTSEQPAPGLALVSVLQNYRLTTFGGDQTLRRAWTHDMVEEIKKTESSSAPRVIGNSIGATANFEHDRPFIHAFLSELGAKTNGLENTDAPQRIDTEGRLVALLKNPNLPEHSITGTLSEVVKNNQLPSATGLLVNRETGDKYLVLETKVPNVRLILGDTMIKTGDQTKPIRPMFVISPPLDTAAAA